MKYEVKIDSISREQWEQCAKLFADYSIYQTWSYQQVRAEMDRQSISRVIITDEVGNLVTMCQVRIKNVRALRLRIGYVQWGPLFRRKDGQVDCPIEAMNKLREAFVGSRVDILRLVPNINDDQTGKQIAESLIAAGFLHVPDHRNYRTIVLPIDCSCEKIQSRLHGSFRRKLKKAESAGIEVQQGNGPEFMAILERLYLASVKRKNFKGLNPDEFTRPQALLSVDEKMSLLVAYKDAEPISVLLMSNLGDTSIVLLPATTEKGLKCWASYLVAFRGVIAAKNAGMKICDLGGIDPMKNPNLYLFKFGTGGNEVFHIGAFEAYTGPVAMSLWRVVERTYQLISGKGR